MNLFNRASRGSPYLPTRTGLPAAIDQDTPRKARIRSSVPNEYYELKTRIHDHLLTLLDLSLLDTVDPEILKPQIRRLVEQMLQEDPGHIPLNKNERELFFSEMQDEVFGLGPLEPFLQDPTVSDILVNNYRQIYVERFGRLYATEARFKDDNHLRKIIDKIVSAVGRRIDESSPMVDARLPDGSRVNAIIPPLALDGPVVSIRRFGRDVLEISDLIALKSLTPEIAELLRCIVQARLNVLISGGTGSGKTTLLNTVSRFIPEEERIITIEDAAELQLKQEHIVRLETRPPNIEGKGEVTQRDLVRNSLRMRPDRIIVGEVRGREAFDMLQAMNTGHDGSLTTIHANSPRDALMRLETMVATTGLRISGEFLRKFVTSALDVVVQTARLVDGTRKVISIQEIIGMEGDVMLMQELFVFEQTGIHSDGRVKGVFRPTGIRPGFVEKFERMAVPFPQGLFDPGRRFEV